MRSHYLTIMTNQAKDPGKDPGGKRWKYEVYFPHKAGARNDPKLVKVFLKFKWSGVGIYWALMEILREAPDYKYPADDLDALAHSLSLKPDELGDIISLFVRVDLLKKEEGFYYSAGLLGNMKKVHEKSEKARASANAKWDKRKTNAQQTQSERNANGMQEQNRTEHKPLKGFSVLDSSSVPNSSGNAPHLDPLGGSGVTLPPEVSPEAAKEITRILDQIEEKITAEQREFLGQRISQSCEEIYLKGLYSRIRRDFVFENKKFHALDLEKILAEYENAG